MKTAIYVLCEPFAGLPQRLQISCLRSAPENRSHASIELRYDRTSPDGMRQCAVRLAGSGPGRITWRKILRSMNFDDNFRRIGDANIEPIRALVDKVSSESWGTDGIDGRRGDERGGDEGVKTIPLVYDSELRHTQPTRHPALEIFEPVIRPVLAIVAEFYDGTARGKELTRQHGLGYFIRAGLIAISPGGTSPPLRDEAFSLVHAHRVHVPIATNPGLRLTVGRESLNVPEGEIYEINNRRVFSVRNEGDTTAVHLVLDYVLKGEMCCCGQKLHPQVPCSPSACLDTDSGRVECACFPEAAA